MRTTFCAALHHFQVPKNGARSMDAESVGAMLSPLEAMFVERLEQYTVREVGYGAQIV